MDVLKSGLESGGVVLWGQSDEFWGKNFSVVVDVEDFHTIGEWSDIKLLEELGARGIDNITDVEKIFFIGDLDLTSENFGGDFEGMEKLNIGWVDSGWSGWDGDGDWGDLTNSGSGWDGETLDLWF